MDDTGNSVLHHLHFSIHDRNLAHPDVPYGRSVRPSPMSSVTLGDGASGKCLRSTNPERVPGLNFKPRVISFGAVAVGGIRTRILAIENTAGAAVTASFPGSNAPPFTWPAFNQTIPDGESRTVVVQFAPVDEGLVQKVILVSSNAPGSPHTVKVSGRGLGDIEPEQGVRRDHLDRGLLERRRSVQRTVVVPGQDGQRLLAQLRCEADHIVVGDSLPVYARRSALPSTAEPA